MAKSRKRKFNRYQPNNGKRKQLDDFPLEGKAQPVPPLPRRMIAISIRLKDSAL